MSVVMRVLHSGTTFDGSGYLAGVRILVQPGQGSVARMLYRAGLVDLETTNHWLEPFSLAPWVWR